MCGLRATRRDIGISSSDFKTSTATPEMPCRRPSGTASWSSSTLACTREPSSWTWTRALQEVKTEKNRKNQSKSKSFYFQKFWFKSFCLTRAPSRTSVPSTASGLPKNSVITGKSTPFVVTSRMSSLSLKVKRGIPMR